MSVIRGVRVDGEDWILNYGSGVTDHLHLLCPECGGWNLISREQEVGAVSVVCPYDGCSFHETHDWKAARFLGPPTNFESPLANEATCWIGIRLRRREWPVTT